MPDAMLGDMADRLIVRLLIISLLWLSGCSRKDRPLFKLLTPAQTGDAFANTITTNDSANVQSDPYVYNGAGVAVGDKDNEGLPDICFMRDRGCSRPSS